MKTLQRVVQAALVAAAAGSTPAFAQEVTSPAAAVQAPATTDAGAFGAADAIGEADLRKVTGRDDIGAMVASATQRNTVSNNSVIGNSSTGNVRIDGNAFQNLQGLAVISANSGNNVAMNSAMNVTVNLAPR